MHWASHSESAAKHNAPWCGVAEVRLGREVRDWQATYQFCRSTCVPYPPEPRSSLSGSHRDRKSTRLNSSHSQISYAVFCLKKKTDTSHSKTSGFSGCHTMTRCTRK